MELLYVLPNGTWVIIGGKEVEGTSELNSGNGFKAMDKDGGEEIADACLAAINATHVFVSGGSCSGDSAGGCMNRALIIDLAKWRFTRDRMHSCQSQD